MSRSEAAALPPSNTGWSGWMQRHPLWLREWRATSRLVRTPWLLGLTSLSMASLVLLVAVSQHDYVPAAAVSRLLFQTFFGAALLFTALVGPAMAASSIALEREGKTWEALLMAGVTPREVDRGKFLGAYTHLGLYWLALLPAAALPHLHGGVSLVETLLGLVMVMAVGAVAVRFGLAISAAVSSTRLALLLTAGASALVVFAVVAGSFGMGEVLRRTGMESVARDTPVFWPVALSLEALSYDYVRLLLVGPVALIVASWVWLRALGIAAMTPPREETGRGVRVAFATMTPLIVFTLAMMPERSFDGLVLTQLAFAIYVFFAILVLVGGGGTVGNTRPQLLRSSALVLTGGIAGMWALPWLASRLTTELEPRAMTRAMSFYGPAFTTFLVGVAALAHARLRRPNVARGVVFANAAVVALAPAFLAVALSTAAAARPIGEPKITWPMALSPIGALDADNIGEAALWRGAALWFTVGVVLLVLAAARSRAVPAHAQVAPAAPQPSPTPRA